MVLFHPKTVKFVIGHTFEEIPAEQQATRTVFLENGTEDTRPYKYDWKVYLDVIDGDPRPVIARIKVDFGHNFHRQRRFEWNCPISRNNGSNKEVWRCFESRQRCWGFTPITFTIFGMGGTEKDVDYYPRLGPKGGFFSENKPPVFDPIGRNTYLKPIRLPLGASFSMVQWGPNYNGRQFIDDLLAKVQWEEGEDGIEKFRQSLESSKSCGCPKDTIISIKLVENSPTEDDLEKVMKLSQNFIKYEATLDHIIELNRKVRGLCTPEGEEVCLKSNVSSILGHSNRARHDAITYSSSSLEDLVEAMNPSKTERYKLHFAKEQGAGAFMAQFGFQAVPDDIHFSMALLRFCRSFVHNSFRLRKPMPLKPSRSMEEKVDMMFSLVVRDRFVEEELRCLRQTNGFEIEQQSQNQDSWIPPDIITVGSSVLTDKVSALADEFSLSTDGVSLSDSFLKSIGLYPNRKRDLPLQFMSAEKKTRPNIPQPTHCDILYFSDIKKENKYMTHARLGKIGRVLGTSLDKKKERRLKWVREYFTARSEELMHVSTDPESIDVGIHGIEVLFRRDESRNKAKISVILKGGKVLTLVRSNVCKSQDFVLKIPSSVSEMSQAEAKCIVEKLYGGESIRIQPNDYFAVIDEYIDFIDLKGGSDNPCRFALLHDYFKE